MQISCRQWYEPSKEKDPDIDKLISEYENERNVKDKVLESLRLCESEYESEQKKVRNFGAKSATFLKLNGLLPANDDLEGYSSLVIEINGQTLFDLIGSKK